MMDLEPLREAARLMRERAMAAVDSEDERWAVDSSPDHGLIVGSYTLHDVSEDGTRSTACVAYFAYPGDEDQRTYNRAFSVASHMAAWQPATALAVADWLDTGANPYSCVDREPMFRVAHAYLGTQP